MKDLEHEHAFRLWMKKYRSQRLTYAQRMDFDARFGIFSGELKRRIRTALKWSPGSPPPHGQ